MRDDFNLKNFDETEQTENELVLDPTHYIKGEHDAYIEEMDDAYHLRLSEATQTALALRALKILEQYNDGLMNPADDWRVLSACGMIIEWVTDPLYGMSDWVKNDNLWEERLDPALQALFGTPYEAVARKAERWVIWARAQWQLLPEDRHHLFERQTNLNQPDL